MPATVFATTARVGLAADADDTHPIASMTPHSLLTTLFNLLVVRDEDSKERAPSWVRHNKSPPRRSSYESFDFSSDGTDSGHEGTHSEVSVYIEARLHPEDVDAIFTHSIPTEEMRTAWRSGGPRPRTRKRLKIIAHDASDEDIYPRWAAVRQAWQLEEEGREWWEAGARLADGNGKIPWQESEHSDEEEEEGGE